MITKSKESVIAMILTLSFVIASGIAVYYYKLSGTSEDALMGEKVKSEKMLSEKLALAKEIDKLKKEIDSHKGQNTKLDKKLADLEKTLNSK